jgi:hypothetical protein
MSQDNLILLTCYITYGLTLTTLIIRSKSKAKTLFINLIFLFAYSGLFIYNLIYNSQGGSGLVWLFYLIISIGLHWFLNIIGIIRTVVNSYRQNKTGKFNLSSSQDYWDLFNELIELLEADNKTSIVSDFKNAQKYLNGLTDGWYEFKYALEKSLKSNRQLMTEKQINITEFLISSLNQSLSNG